MTKNTDTAISSSPPSFMQKVEVAEEKVEREEKRELTSQEIDEMQKRQATIEKATSRLEELSNYLEKIAVVTQKFLPEFIAKNPLGVVLDKFIELETQVKMVESRYKEIAEVISMAREVSFPTRLDIEEARTFTSKDTGSRVSRSTKVYASIKSDTTGETQAKAYEWLRRPVFFEPLTDEQKKIIGEGGEVKLTPLHPWAYNDQGEIVLAPGVNDEDQPNYGSLIKETVNSSSLSALAKEIMEMGRELPEDLFRIHSKDGVSITKGKKK